jgi:hypothetical protein
METSTSRGRDVAYRLHPFTNLGRHESEGPLVITDEMLRRFAKALDETAEALGPR